MDRYYYEYEADSRHCYPETHVLINKFGIHDASRLHEAERRITAVTVLEVSNKPVKGTFDLKHLMGIHKAVFCDVYDWAGQLRTVNIAKGNQFCQSAYLVDYASDLFGKLKAEDYLSNVGTNELHKRLTYYLSEVNVLHPFREGNGRTQRVFIDYLARYNGFHLNFADVTDDEMIEASALAFDMDYSKLEPIMGRIMEPITKAEQDAFRKAVKPR